MAQTKPRKIVSLAGDGRFVVPVAAGATILQSALVILAAGAARPGREGQGADNAAKAADAATYVAVGVAQETVTGGAANGDVKITVDRSRPYASRTRLPATPSPSPTSARPPTSSMTRRWPRPPPTRPAPRPGRSKTSPPRASSCPSASPPGPKERPF